MVPTFLAVENRKNTWIGLFLLIIAWPALAAELVPPATDIKHDRPRLLLRAADTPRAISLKQLQALPRDVDFQRMLEQLESLKPPRAAALALAYHLTHRPQLAERALAVMRSWQMPQDKQSLNDPFNVYFTLLDMAFAYDWLHGYPGFDDQSKTTLRQKLRPFTANALRLGDDHVFHNYIWMYNGGAMLWALATVGEDPEADRLFARLHERFNHQLFRAMEYLGGANGDSAGYWWFYCQNSAVLVLLATQSAFETDVISAIQRDHHDWLNRQLDYLVLSVLPDMRFIPWGDIVAGANGGATHEMADKIDALTWALKSPHGAFLSRWLDGKRGLNRFHGETAIFYFFYTRHLSTAAATPPLALLAGGKAGGEVLMRSDWTGGATVVGFRCTDFYGQHHHLDQGSFVIYRNGWLALDAGTYQRVAGPQMKTDAHNTLLLGGQGQRPQRYQSANTLEAFTQRLPKGLDTGDILFYHRGGDWTAAAGQFAQAYAPEVIQSCVRQILFARPGTVVVIDRLKAPEGKSLPDIQWLLQVPARPELGERAVTARNAQSFLRCRALGPGCRRLHLEDSYRTPAGPPSARGNPASLETSRAVFTYEGAPELVLIHVLDVGDGEPIAAMPAIAVKQDPEALRITMEGKTATFFSAPSFEVKVDGR